METNIKYAVIGGGSWATAIVKMLTTNESKVGWYMRSVYAKEHLLNAKHNPNYLSSVEFNTDKLLLTNDIISDFSFDIVRRNTFGYDFCFLCICTSNSEIR